MKYFLPQNLQPSAQSLYIVRQVAYKYRKSLFDKDKEEKMKVPIGIA